MWLLILEAGVAMFLLVFIVWWTMYSGPKIHDEPIRDEQERRDTPDGAGRAEGPDR